MRVNITGYAVTAFMLAIGVALILSPVLLPGYTGGAFGPLVGVVWSAVALLTWGYGIAQRRRARREDELYRSGVRGRARIVEHRRAGFVSVGQPRMRLTMEVELPGMPERRITKTMPVPEHAIARLDSELVLPVVADRERPSELFVQW